MCDSLQLLSQSKHGSLSFCNHSKLFNLIFNNLCFELYEWELETFRSYIEQLDIDYWEKEFRYGPYERKIPISVGKKHFIILVSKDEILEIKMLLKLGPKHIELLDHTDINYQFIAN